MEGYIFNSFHWFNSEINLTYLQNLFIIVWADL
jgi:hypothetical protein